MSRFFGRCLAAGIFLALVGFVSAQTTPEQMAQMVLDSAKKAYNEKNYPFAAQRFREFLAKYGNHKDANNARYGLALALLDGPTKDYPAALEQLNPLANVKDFSERPFVLYYQGLAQRGIGVQLLATATAKPQEAPQLQNQATQRFAEAAQRFADAAAAFASRVKEAPAAGKPLPLDLEWSARARCDQAEMQLRTLKPKEAAVTAALFLKGPLTGSRYRGLGLYYHGFAHFLLGEYRAAGRSLSQLAPFTDPIFGTHARYLLARAHHQSDELAEAATHYESVLTDYEKNKKDAQAILQSGKVNNDPEERARLETLLRGPAPDHVGRSAFYLGVLQYQGGKFAEAQARFTAFVQQNPRSPLLPEAQLRQGFCLVQTKDFANALKVLQPLADKEPRLADQALLWIGKAQVGQAEAGKPQEKDGLLRTAIDTFRRAAEKAQQLAGTDPDAKRRRGEIQIELGDAQQLAKQYREAVATYDQAINEKAIPRREEEIHQRRVTALHLAGDYAACEQACAAFQKAYPQSTLLPAVLFRLAENAYFSLLNAEKIGDANTRAKEVARLSEETAKRYQVVIDKYPEFQHVNLARHGAGLVSYRKGDFDKARGYFDAIPGPDRRGDLAGVPYLLADCLMRLAPTKVDDAIAAGKMREVLQPAVEMLESFIAADPKGTQTPNALIKIGLCQQRLAAIIGQPPEKAKVLTAARLAYERLMREFPQHALVPQAVLERAKCLAQENPDKNPAINELRRFTADPLRNAPVAPMAVLELASLLREQNKPAEAVKVLADCRQQQEANLAKDPARAGWVPLLQYHHAAALRDSGKLPEARALFEQVAKTGGTSTEAADASLRVGQCLLQEGKEKIEAARKAPKPDEKAVQAAYQTVRDAIVYFEQQAGQWKQKQPMNEIRARMHYESAWGHRWLAEPEVAAAREKMREEAAKKDPKAGAPAVAALPDVPPSTVPLQPSEKKAQEQYQTLIAEFPDAAIATDARFELAEMHAQRDDFNPAIQLLNQALDREPSQELTDKIRLRLAALLAAKKDAKAALTQFDLVANNPKSPLAMQARYRAGECLLALNQPAEAVKRLIVFRDQPMFQNVPGVSDRALLRLGHALARQSQWDPSIQAHQLVIQRFPNSPWAAEARYGTGWAMQNKKDYDNAVNWYTQVANGTATELGAKSQLQIGLCRMEQKRYPEAAAALLVVPFTFDYPELSAAALCEAARANVEQKQPDQAEKLLRRVLKDYPKSKWAEVARERLEALKKG